MRAIPFLFALVALAGCKSPSSQRTVSVAAKHPMVRVASTIDCPKLIHHVRPDYPKEARRKRTQGTVRLKAVITKKGEVSDIEVVKGDPLLITAALSAVRRWRYAPCVINSEAVDVVTSIDINFDLSQ